LITGVLVRFTPYISVLLLAASAFGQQVQLPKEVEAVQRYILEKDYPELFGDKPYRTKIENAIVADLDDDGRPEVVVHFTPHYRQSAPIVIYRVEKGLQVTRVKEGLAPGPLVPLTGAYLDSHTLGMGVDFIYAFKTAEEEAARKKVVEIGLQRFGGYVQYKSFSHADARSGNRAYIDMTHATVAGGKDSCADFEFSRVAQISAGRLGPELSRTYLAALVGEEIWLYRIDEFLPNGLLKKTLKIEKAPGDFLEFAPLSGPYIRYRARNGEMKALRLRLGDP